MTISDTHAASIVKVRVDFGFSGFSCSPSLITELLQVKPDVSEQKGATKQLRNGREFVIPMSSWSISSKSISKDVNDHLLEVLSVMVPVKENFQPEWGIPHLGILWKNSDLYAGNGPYYEASVIEKIAVVGCEVYHDIYQIDE